jgi:hypothetical protein
MVPHLILGQVSSGACVGRLAEMHGGWFTQGGVGMVSGFANQG